MRIIIDRDEPDGEIHCDVCYEPFIAPLTAIEEVRGSRVICSTCECEHRRAVHLKRLTEQHHPETALPPAICECGFTSDKCHAENCQPWSAKSPRQGKLL